MGEGEPVIIEPIQVVSVLNRFLSGDLNAKQIEDWAHKIECREDLDYEKSNLEQVEQVIYELANPELEGRTRLNSVTRFLWFSRFHTRLIMITPKNWV